MLQNEKYLEILKNNKGFADPKKWVIYAEKNNFKNVEAINISSCPDCGSAKLKKIAQYIYYSNLIKVVACKECGLIFSDVLLNDEVIKRHFEDSYKDDKYFEYGRHAIFSQTASIAVSYLPKGGAVLDIGGAKGHLASTIKKLRDDVSITINDISIDACNYISEKYPYKTICCSLSELGNSTDSNFDVVLLIDVLYYEKNLKEALTSILQLTKENGVVILRIPNKLWLIRSIAFFKRCFLSRKKQELSDTITLINPEHLYFFSQKYLHNKFINLGCKKIQFLPAETLAFDSHTKELFSKLFYQISKCIYFMSFKKLVITPAQLIVISK